jgi:hypothetical protein
VIETRYGVTSKFTYTATGEIDTKTDARNNVTTYSDYFRGIPRKEIRPEKITVTREGSN